MSNFEMNLKREMGMEADYTGATPRPSFANGFAVGAGAAASAYPATGVAIGDTTLTEARLRSFGRLIEAKTTAGTAFGGSGANVEAIMNQGTITIPANTLSAGDVVKLRVAVAIPTTVSTDTLALNVRINGVSGTVLATLPAVDVANGDFLVADVDVVIRTSTTAYAVSRASVTVDGSQGAYAKLTALTGLDLTAAITFDITAVWSTQSANAASVQQFSAVVYGG